MFRHDQLRKTNRFRRTHVYLWRSLKHMDLDSPKNECTLLGIVFNQRTVVTGSTLHRLKCPNDIYTIISDKSFRNSLSSVPKGRSSTGKPSFCIFMQCYMLNVATTFCKNCSNTTRQKSVI